MIKARIPQTDQDKTKTKRSRQEYNIKINARIPQEDQDKNNIKR